MRPSRTKNAAGPPDWAVAVQYDRSKQARHPRGEYRSARTCADRDLGAAGLGSPLGTRTVKLEEAATDVGRGQHTLHGGAIVQKIVDLSVVESGSSMTTVNV